MFPVFFCRSAVQAQFTSAFSSRPLGSIAVNGPRLHLTAAAAADCIVDPARPASPPLIVVGGDQRAVAVTILGAASCYLLLTCPLIIPGSTIYVVSTVGTSILQRCGRPAILFIILTIVATPPAYRWTIPTAPPRCCIVIFVIPIIVIQCPVSRFNPPRFHLSGVAFRHGIGGPIAPAAPVGIVGT